MSSSSALADRPRVSRPARRIVSSCDRPRGRAGGARPSGRPVLRRRRRLRARARRRSRAFPAAPALGVAIDADPPQSACSDVAAMRALLALLCAEPARRRARPWLQGRPLCAARRGLRRRRARSAPTRRTAAASITRRAACCTGSTWVERALARRTDLFLFESDHIRAEIRRACRRAAGLRRVVVNGLGAAEFVAAAPRPTRPTSSMSANCARPRASTRCSTRSRSSPGDGKAPTAALVGSGPDRDALIAHAARLGLAGRRALSRPDAGARGFRARPHHGGALARRIDALRRAGGGGGAGAADDHPCRRHPGNFWPVPRPARPGRRSRRSRVPDS